VTPISVRTAGVVALVGVLGWVGLVWLGVQLYGTNPPTAAFDLELLLRAGRAVAAGQSPYDPAMLAGGAPVAERLFYSYPPIVAQVMAVFATVPSAPMFVAWTGLAVAAFGLVVARLAARFASEIRPLAAALVAMAFVPLMFPFAVGLLFGNLDVFFPSAYGLVVLGVVGGSSTRDEVVAGSAASVAVIGKLQPASIGLWLVARASSVASVRLALAAAFIVGIAVVGLSIVIGGFRPWLDYLTVVRAGSGADLVDPRNAGPAAQIALLLGGGGSSGEALARTLQIPVSIGALLLAVVAAVRVREPVESLAWAVVASFVLLPVTWYHYPAALIPFAVVAVLRSAADRQVGGRVRRLVLAAGVLGAFAIAWIPLLYVAVGLVLVAIHLSVHSLPGRDAPAGAFQS
jgi:Glycosyltransferase family 87